MIKEAIKGAVIAGAIASMLSGGAALAKGKGDKAAGGDDVKCAGVNSCKGTGACNGADHSCAGKNGCKGQGWIKTTAKECKDKGGTIVAEK